MWNPNFDVWTNNWFYESWSYTVVTGAHELMGTTGVEGAYSDPKISNNTFSDMSSRVWGSGSLLFF